MSKLAEFRLLERKLAEQLKELEALKSDEGLKKEIEFESRLRNLLADYGFSLKNVVAVLDPHAAAPLLTNDNPVTARKTRKARVIKVFKNPETGEVVETKGGNHRTLKEWKTKYGADVVDSWLVH
ncbi:DNA binding protein [Pseudomonas cichorii]|nr:histone-like nucleoid-structuring protein, MvaT/MvaU family [Pseudomonas cichorii]MBX8539757.1 DNA binding protein [Pseudomonas cichorii]MBX8545588.1 DNA binding protein [Pseudomonas cichorii]MBX8559693.1 DNA binding protein [Pseudomonas cichorii]MBX8565468.1 DNA binding protein [Pseudomonas cichorii]MBX8569304.1 DNA binding protein [Pseudomonas cichorii]